VGTGRLYNYAYDMWLDPSSAKVKNAWNDTSTTQYIFMAWYLANHGTTLSLPYYVAQFW